MTHPMPRRLPLETRSLKALLLAASGAALMLSPATGWSQSLPPMQYGSDSGFTNYSQQAQPQPQYQSPAYPQPGYQAPAYQPGYTQPGYSQPGYSQGQPYVGRVSTVPAGTFLSASVSTALSSEFSRVGDRVTATLGNAITGSDGTVIIPPGSQLEGQVMMVRPAGRTGRNGELDVRFTAALLPTGQRIPLSARVQTEDGTGIIKGGTTAGRVGRAALNTGVGAGLGAALGTAMGPLSGGEVGRGAIFGTAIGGGAGLAKALWDKGQEALLQPGTPLNVTLDQPLTVAPQSSAPAYGGGGGYGSGGYGGYNNYNGGY